MTIHHNIFKINMTTSPSLSIADPEFQNTLLLAAIVSKKKPHFDLSEFKVDTDNIFN